MVDPSEFYRFQANYSYFLNNWYILKKVISFEQSEPPATIDYWFTGDLMYETSPKNSRYRPILHLELGFPASHNLTLPNSCVNAFQVVWYVRHGNSTILAIDITDWGEFKDAKFIADVDCYDFLPSVTDSIECWFGFSEFCDNQFLYTDNMITIFLNNEGLITDRSYVKGKLTPVTTLNISYYLFYDKIRIELRYFNWILMGLGITALIVLARKERQRRIELYSENEDIDI